MSGRWAIAAALLVGLVSTACGGGLASPPATGDSVLATCVADVVHANGAPNDPTAIDFAIVDCTSLDMLRSTIQAHPGYLGPGATIETIALARCRDPKAGLTGSQICHELGVSTRLTAAPASGAPEPPVVGDGPNRQVALGQPFDVFDQDGRKIGTARVLKSRLYPSNGGRSADAGKVYVGVDVAYDAAGELDYGSTDWNTHDTRSQMWRYDGNDLKPALGLGTLKPGQQREGWLSFQVPKTTEHLWIDRRNGDGGVDLVPLF